MNASKYLNRIGITNPSAPNLNFLFQLQQHHLLHIPFENLDIHLGRKIILDYEAIFEKVVEDKRGGFCYELNGLFYLLLKELGYSVKIISARVKGDSGRIGKEGDHLAIIATIDKQDWLVDVGFGKFSFLPLKISLDEVQDDQRGLYRISKHDETYLGVYTKEKKEDWKLGYLFTMQARSFSFFEEMCHYHQTSPASSFTKRKIITIPTPKGRITLTSTKLKIAQADQTKTSAINSEKEFQENLKRYFNIECE